jgi:hypothetical protein
MWSDQGEITTWAENVMHAHFTTMNCLIM